MRVDFANEFASEISTGERFEFGNNWAGFLDDMDETRLGEAISAIQQALGVQTLTGCSVLDIGSGSGLSSLAFHRLGARVTSFDIDPACVACTERLKDRYGSSEREWRVMRGSILDLEFIGSLGQFDVVYSWGVLHHTGEMWRALQIATDAVRPNGKLCIAIYNDQGPWSRCWLAVKKAYNLLPVGFKWLVAGPVFVQQWLPRLLLGMFEGDPFGRWNSYAKKRGMSAWHDLIDWVGGLPFEVARPDAIFNFYMASGFRLVHLKTCGGRLGCNEFTFARAEPN